MTRQYHQHHSNRTRAASDCENLQIDVHFNLVDLGICSFVCSKGGRRSAPQQYYKHCGYGTWILFKNNSIHSFLFQNYNLQQRLEIGDERKQNIGCFKHPTVASRSTSQLVAPPKCSKNE